VTKTNWGLKRQCLKCDSRYYDLGKNPAKCPKCGTMHDINAPVKRRGRAKPVTAVDKDDPLIQVKARQEARQKTVKRIEGVEVEFDDVDTGDEEIEEIEEIEEEDIESLEELEDREEVEEMDDDVTLEDEDVAGAVIVDDVDDAIDDEDEDEDDEEEDEEEDEDEKPKSSKVKKPAAKGGKKPVSSKNPQKPLKKKKK
jgi:hypothetical protein